MKNDFEKFIYLIILVVLLGAILNVPSFFTNLTIQWLVSAFIGSLLSLLAGSLVEAFTGDLLKKITFTIKLFGRKISITAFAIATLLIKVLIFGF